MLQLRLMIACWWWEWSVIKRSLTRVCFWQTYTFRLIPMKTFEKKSEFFIDLINELLLDLINIPIYFKKTRLVDLFISSFCLNFLLLYYIAKGVTNELTKQMNEFLKVLVRFDIYQCLPGPQSCSPRRKRLRWRRAPACALLRLPHPGCGSPTALGPAGDGCGSELGLQANRWDGLNKKQKEEKKNQNNNHKKVSSSHVIRDSTSCGSSDNKCVRSVPNLVQKWRLCHLWSEPQRTVSHRPLS